MGTNTRVDIDMSAIGITWTKNTTYRIALEEGFIQEDGGEEQPNPVNSNMLTFTTNATGPVISSSDPISGSTNMIGYDEIILTFDRKIILTTNGFIKFYKSGGTLIATYNMNDVYTGDVTLGEDEHELHIKTNQYFDEALTNYYITLDANIIKDYDNFYNDAVTNPTAITFTTGSAPSIISKTPADNATGVTNAQISIQFDRNISKGAGYVEIYEYVTDTLIYQININDSKVTVGADTLEIDLTFLLNSDTHYYVKITQYAIKGTEGIFFGGISSKTVYDFTTAATTAGGGFAFADIFSTSTGYFGIDYPEGVIPVPTTDNITNNIKGIHLYKVNPSGSDYIIHTFYANKTAPTGESASGLGYECTTSSTGWNIAVYAGSYLEYGYDYYFLIDDGAFYDSSTNLLIPGVNTDTTFAFSTNDAVNGMTAKVYDGNQSNDSWFFQDLGYDFTAFTLIPTSSGITYNVELTSTIGKFGLGSSAPTTSLFLDGTISTIQAYREDIKFYPNKDVTSSGTFTVKVREGASHTGAVAVQSTYNLTYSGTTLTSEIVTLYTGISGTWTPTYAQYTYHPNAQVLLVAKGGNGEGATGGAGGGGGEVLEQSGITISNTNYAYTFTTSGTSMFGYTADSGTAGTTNQGGTSGNGYVGSSGSAAAGGGTGGEPANVSYEGGYSSYYGPGLDSTILGSLGAQSLGAGGPDGTGDSGFTTTYALGWQYPRDAGHGGRGATDVSHSTHLGAHGIIAIKLTS